MNFNVNRQDGNEKQKKNFFLRRKIQHPTGYHKHMKTHTSLMKQLGLSVLTLDKIVKHCHVIGENAWKLEDYFFNTYTPTFLILCTEFQCLTSDFKLHHNTEYF